MLCEICFYAIDLDARQYLYDILGNLFLNIITGLVYHYFSIKIFTKAQNQGFFILL